MGMSPVEVSEKLSPGDMWKLTEQMMTKYNQSFEVMEVHGKEIKVRLASGLMKRVFI